MFRITLGSAMDDLVAHTTYRPMFSWPVDVARPSPEVVWKSSAIRYADAELRLDTTVACPPAPEQAANDGPISEPHGPEVSSNEAGEGAHHDSAA